jgi:hypothetical protein
VIEYGYEQDISSPLCEGYRRFTIVVEYSALFQKSQASVDQTQRRLDPSGGSSLAGLTLVGASTHVPAVRL